MVTWLKLYMITLCECNLILHGLDESKELLVYDIQELLSRLVDLSEKLLLEEKKEKLKFLVKIRSLIFLH